MEKRIGILTFHRADNLGAVLQAYALSKYIAESIEIKAEIVDYKCEKVESTRYAHTGNVVKRIPLAVYYKIKRSGFDRFRNEHLPLSATVYTKGNISDSNQVYSTFIAGSDQIWNPYCGGFNPMMFVEFGKDKKRIAYSSSIAQPEIPQQIKERMKQDLLKFKYIGVREQRSVELLNVLLGRTDIRLVVDPTYLLSMEEWMEFGEKAVLEFPLPKKYIFCYFVGDKRKEIYEQMVQDVKKFTGIDDVVTLECYNRKLNYGGGKLYKDGGPYEWVYLLRHASYICMDSFHATVFALKFKKEFVHALKNSDDETESQNTRMYDIFNRYGLSHKIYFPSSSESWQLPIDYSKVTPIMELEIENSIKFLEYSINN